MKKNTTSETTKQPLVDTPSNDANLMRHLIGTPVIVRANVGGVHCGVLEGIDLAKQTVVLKDAYRLWRVHTRDASGSLSDVAANGLKTPLSQHSIGTRLDRVVIVNPQGLELDSATAKAYASIADASFKA